MAGLPESAAGVACGANFSLVNGVDTGVWAFGWSEHGVMGNGSDGEYNKSASSVKLSYEAQTPTPIGAFEDKKVVIVACGAAHCVAVESDGTTYTWGCGDYGRLGHKEQKSLCAERLEPRARPPHRAPANACAPRDHAGGSRRRLRA